MTDDQISAWKVERDMARAIENETDRNKALQTAYDHRDEMMMTCIAHQSKRVKDIMKDHADMVKSHLRYKEECAERRGAKKVFAFLKWIAAITGSGAGGAYLMEFLKASN
jgi:excinuclease UvrABC helicase subunit UvrB